MLYFLHLTSDRTSTGFETAPGCDTVTDPDRAPRAMGMRGRAGRAVGL
jgi:hypothetical protein